MPKTTLEGALKELERSMKRLQPEQGRIARKNARQAVLHRLSKLRRAIDEAFPSIKLEKAGGKRRRTLHERERALRKEGWVLARRDEVVACAIAGVPIKSLGKSLTASFLVPGYVRIAPNLEPSTLRRMKNNIQHRKFLMSVMALTPTEGTP